MLTLAVSIVVYNHEVSFIKVCGAACVFAGVALEAVHRYRRKRD